MDDKQEIKSQATYNMLWHGAVELGPDVLAELGHDLKFELIPLAVHHSIYPEGLELDDLLRDGEQFILENDFPDVAPWHFEIEPTARGRDAVHSLLVGASLMIALGQLSAGGELPARLWPDLAVSAAMMMASAKDRILSVATHYNSTIAPAVKARLRRCESTRAKVQEIARSMRAQGKISNERIAAAAAQKLSISFEHARKLVRKPEQKNGQIDDSPRHDDD